MEIKTVGVVGLGALGLMYGEHIQNAIGRENICFAMDKERFFSKKRFERSIAPFNFLRIIRQSNLTIQHRLQ